MRAIKKPELKPCPFCGGEVKSHVGRFSDIKPTIIVLFKCQKCRAIVSFDNMECYTAPQKAVERFNSRVKHS